MNSYTISEPVYARRGLTPELPTVIWAIVPSLLAALDLYAAVLIFGERFNQYFAVLLVIIIGLCALIMHPARHSIVRLRYSRFQQTIEILGRWMILLFVMLCIGFVLKITDPFPRRVLLTWAVTTPMLIVCASMLFRRWMRVLQMDEANRRHVAIAGYTESSKALAKRIRENPELCLTVEGFFDDRSPERLGAESDAVLLGGLQNLVDFVRARGTDVIFIALPLRNLERVAKLLEDLRDTTASIYYVPDICVLDLIQARTAEVQGIPVVALCETPFVGSRGLSKRLFDIVVSSAALTIGSPVLLLIALLVKLSSPGPVIFQQRRYGLDGDEITVYKFRTMRVTEDGDVIRQAVRGDDRITGVGHFLRRFSLDELPQLINVLQGRMSLVGPRPHAVAHNEMYRKLIKGYMVRHKVLPGITGLAQVNGLRGETRDIGQMEARVHYDLEYLRNWSTLLDLKILAMTAVRILGDRRAY